MGFYAEKHTINADHWEEVESAEYSEIKDEYFCPEGWYEEMWESEYISETPSPTHWMPLPAPPESE